MLAIEWSAAYSAAWDATPERYVEEDIVGWGRSRRLGRYANDALNLKAYLGIQHYDPGRWGVDGAATSKFFLSIFVDRKTISLRTFATMGEALDALTTYQTLRATMLDR